MAKRERKIIVDKNILMFSCLTMIRPDNIAAWVDEVIQYRSGFEIDFILFKIGNIVPLKIKYNGKVYTQIENSRLSFFEDGSLSKKEKK